MAFAVQRKTLSNAAHTVRMRGEELPDFVMLAVVTQCVTAR